MLITARNNLSAQKRGADTGIDTQIAVGDKLASVRALCEQHGIGPTVAFMGDDLPDWPRCARSGWRWRRPTPA